MSRRPRARVRVCRRPRTVCQPGGAGRVVWNATFKQCADYWGFEPHRCRAYRAQTKGTVESGVKYFKRNFLPGRTFLDEQDLRAQLTRLERHDQDKPWDGTPGRRTRDPNTPGNVVVRYVASSVSRSSKPRGTTKRFYVRLAPQLVERRGIIRTIFNSRERLLSLSLALQVEDSHPEN